jgi:hypothetical protein
MKKDTLRHSLYALYLNKARKGDLPVSELQAMK